MEDVEVRFAHLLQPIRDLTKNWEVDVAAQLGEYLEEVRAAGEWQAKQLSLAQEDGSNRAVNSGTPYETEDEFLSLDDFPDSRANVDLKNDQTSSELLIIPLVPMALVAPDEVEKNSSPLYSCQGEILASRKDFRMNTCTPDPRGSFMLDPVGMCPVEPADLCPMPGSQKDAEDAEGQLMEVSGNGSHVSVLNISQEPEGPMLRGGDEDAEDAAEPQEVALEPAEPRTSQQTAPLPRRYMLRERQGNPEPASRLQETPDPWQSLEPFDSLDSKVFQKGKPFSVPPGMEEPPGHKRKRKRATKLQDFHQWYLAAYADHADSRRPRRKGPTFADMEVLYWKHVKEQLESLQKLQRQKASAHSTRV
ncbi:Condensin-2 complex subunit H2 [Microtus ochrogaster]|uniref:Condensin-2 complex subunit H2 n=1 Tax=Microtus ochrogaster TaxID=79684 RepID=A0A8J6H0Q9_MICOH|nr:Condensin-2 complex subunit H2 [Microtus ochrogaster]